MKRNREDEIRFTGRAALFAAVLVLVGSIAVQWVAYETNVRGPVPLECRR
jgi:hypothetical protein